MERRFTPRKCRKKGPIFQKKGTDLTIPRQVPPTQSEGKEATREKGPMPEPPYKNPLSRKQGFYFVPTYANRVYSFPCLDVSTSDASLVLELELDLNSRESLLQELCFDSCSDSRAKGGLSRYLSPLCLKQQTVTYV